MAVNVERDAIVTLDQVADTVQRSRRKTGPANRWEQPWAGLVGKCAHHILALPEDVPALVLIGRYDHLAIVREDFWDALLKIRPSDSTEPERAALVVWTHLVALGRAEL